MGPWTVNSGTPFGFRSVLGCFVELGENGDAERFAWHEAMASGSSSGPKRVEMSWAQRPPIKRKTGTESDSLTR